MNSTLKDWAGGERANLALVFTDIVDSTKLGKELGNERMNRLRDDHVAQGKRLIAKFEGRFIKLIGDSIMAPFKSVDKALDFARRLHENPGHPRARIRAGIHVGIMDVQGEDLFGTDVNLAARVVGENKGEEIWLSQQAKDQLDQLGLERFEHLQWAPHAVTPKGFEPTTFWSMNTIAWGVSPIPAPAYKTFTTNLPPMSDLLLGREDQLKFLDDAWADTQVNAVQIIAEGGTGKTALMDKWFRPHVNDAHVFAWSFYIQGSTQDRQTSSDDFFAQALPFFGIPPPEDKSPVAKAKALVEWMRAQRTLLILDGVEPLQDQHGSVRDLPLKSLLNDLRTRNLGMVLCTTRQRIKELPDNAQTRSWDLKNLEPEDGARLLEKLGVDGTDQERKNASGRFGNHALAVTLLGTYLRDFHHGDVRRIAEIRQLLTDETDEARHAKNVMASYARMFEGRPEREILLALGYFDRPAEPEALRIVLGKDPDRATLVRLRKARLLLNEDPAGELDCHPLVREYFGSVIPKEKFREGHGLLFEYYKAKAEHRPDTRKQMEPLFHAVYHGCQAGRHQEACVDVYFNRVYRGKEFYLYHTLGKWGTNLSLLANFFVEPWEQPADRLSSTAQSWLIGEAGYTLRALGRLADATAPMRASAELAVKQEDWINAATRLSNISELLSTLGNLSEAVAAAWQSVGYADRSENDFERYTDRTTLADALHQSGDLAAAKRLFSEAEEMQAKDAPHTPLLYSLRGHQYCDLLLDQGRREEVLQRASQTIHILKRPLDIGLNHLTLGRALPQSSLESRRELDLAIENLRQAGQQEHLPPALLARATEDDLAEAFEIATRSGMRLHLADYHLIQARRLKSKDHFQEAKRLIEETGYRRRDRDLEELRIALGIS